MKKRGKSGARFIGRRIEWPGVLPKAAQHCAQLGVAATGALVTLWLLSPSPALGKGTQAPQTQQPSAAALVQQVRQAEQWVHEIDGLRVRFEGKWTRSPESIAARKSELQGQFPNDYLTSEHFEDLRKQQTETLEIVFDQHRFKLVNRRQGGGGREETWDGNRAVQRLFSPTENAVSIEPRPYHLGRSLFGDLSWLRSQPHDFSWISAEFDDLPAAQRREQKVLRAQWRDAEFELIGKELYRGLNCWRLARNQPGFESWLVGVDTGWLHGILSGELPDPEQELRTGIDVLSKRGISVKSRAEIEEWVARQDPATKRQIIKEFERLQTASIRPISEHWLLDYKELAHGRWFPMTQGYRCWTGVGTNVQLQFQREFRTLEVRFETNLPTEFFKVEIPEGVLVTDHTHDPWLLYRQKKNRTPEEWQAVINAAKEREGNEEQRQTAMDAVVGKPAPPFPREARWLNSEPLNWEKLKGRAVVLDFFAEWCGPCRKDLPVLSKAHLNRDQAGVLILGIHTPGSRPEAIRKMLTEHRLKYPICIDVPPAKEAKSWGHLFDQYQVQTIPHAFAVDQQGTVAGHGEIGEVLRIAHDLALADASKKPKGRE